MEKLEKLEKHFDLKCMFFTDEFRIDMGLFTKGSTRLCPETKKKIKNG